jgi:hypothetical protein
VLFASFCLQLTISLEDGTELAIEVPEGVGPGDEIEIQHPTVGEGDVSP